MIDHLRNSESGTVMTELGKFGDGVHEKAPVNLCGYFENN